MEWLRQDLRYGLRVLAKSPLFNLVAAVSLALGIGANTTIFTLVDAVFLNPLPVHQPSRLVAVFTTDEKNTGGFLTHLQTSYLNYQDYRDKNEVFSGLAAHQFVPQLSLVVEGSPPEQVVGQVVTGNYFEVLGIRPGLGRFFLPDEDKTPGAHPVVVLSHGLWQRRFGGDPGVVGKTILLNSQGFTVVGVAPVEFRGTTPLFGPDLWLPSMMWKQVVTGAFRDWIDERRPLVFDITGRLKDKVDLRQAEANLKTVGLQLERDYPEPNKGRNVTLVPLAQGAINPGFRGQMIAVSWLLMGVVVVVLLIACSNVANLLLARANVRRKEIAIRLSMGASRRRVIRQLLTEAILLGLAGGALGLVFAIWGLDLLWAFRPPFVPDNIARPGISGTVLGFTFVISVLTGVLFGLVPALQASRPNVSAELKNELQTVGRGFARLRFGNLLVVGQIALSLVALICAGLFLRSLVNAQKIDPGFEMENLAVLNFNLGTAGYDPVRGRAFQRQLTEQVERLPGVGSASLATVLPLSGGGLARSVFPEGKDTAEASGVLVPVNSVGLGYFETLGVTLLRGRDFSEADREGSLLVAVVNETMAKRFWPDRDPLGARFRFYGDEAPREVVGVARDGKYFSLGEDPQPFVYVPLLQNYDEAVTLQVRTMGDPAVVLASVQREIQALDRSLPVLNPRTISEVLSQSLWAPRMGAGLLGLFGGLALLLASVGIYGVMAYSVSQRTQEIGIRVAMGAARRDVLALVLKEGMRTVGIGVAFGVALSLVAARLLSSLLFGVGAADPATFSLTPLLLAGVALLATYLPARRAAAVDPISALRFQ
jgi:predicted permease